MQNNHPNSPEINKIDDENANNNDIELDEA